jgi:hypothetical protein
LVLGKDDETLLCRGRNAPLILPVAERVLPPLLSNRPLYTACEMLPQKLPTNRPSFLLAVSLELRASVSKSSSPPLRVTLLPPFAVASPVSI